MVERNGFRLSAGFGIGEQRTEGIVVEGGRLESGGAFLFRAEVADAIDVGSVKLPADRVEAFGGPGHRILGDGLVQ